MFNLFKKNEPKTSFTDKTFASLAAKKRACIALAQQDASAIFIAWFPETAQTFSRAFEAHGLSAEKVMEVHGLHSAKLTGHTVFFLEHHPLRAKEEALVANWPAQTFTVYNSLEDGLLKHFGGDRIATMMQKMGMQEDEMIEHAMVSKSIAGAQEKIAREVIAEQPAASQTAWMEKNFKKTKPW